MAPIPQPIPAPIPHWLDRLSAPLSVSLKIIHTNKALLFLTISGILSHFDLGRRWAAKRVEPEALLTALAQRTEVERHGAGLLPLMQDMHAQYSVHNAVTATPQSKDEDTRSTSSFLTAHIWYMLNYSWAVFNYTQHTQLLLIVSCLNCSWRPLMKKCSITAEELSAGLDVHTIWKPFWMFNLYFPPYNTSSLFLALPSITRENNLYFLPLCIYPNIFENFGSPRIFCSIKWAKPVTSTFLYREHFPDLCLFTLFWTSSNWSAYFLKHSVQNWVYFPTRHS